MHSVIVTVPDVVPLIVIPGEGTPPLRVTLGPTFGTLLFSTVPPCTSPSGSTKLKLRTSTVPDWAPTVQATPNDTKRLEIARAVGVVLLPPPQPPTASTA